MREHALAKTPKFKRLERPDVACLCCSQNDPRGSTVALTFGLFHYLTIHLWAFPLFNHIPLYMTIKIANVPKINPGQASVISPPPGTDL